MKTLNENYHDIFVTIENGFNPDTISIANDLEFYDCFDTPNLYFVYIMDDGSEIVDYEDLFEGHDIPDAFNYADKYLEEYDSYEQSYLIETHRINEDEVDSENIRNIVIL